MATTLRTTIPIYALIFALFLLALISTGGMLADIVSFRAILQERYWARGEAIENLEQWQKAESQAKFALALAPGHPDYQLLLGRLASWRLYVPDEQQELTSEIGQGYRAFNSALTTRPYWSEGWSEFALLKAQIDEVDEEFEFAVYTSMATGPYEQLAILNLLKATLGVWDKLDEALKEETIYLFDLALALPYNGLSPGAVSIAQHYELLDVLCASELLSEESADSCAKSIKREVTE